MTLILALRLYQPGVQIDSAEFDADKVAFGNTRFRQHGHPCLWLEGGDRRGLGARFH